MAHMHKTVKQNFFHKRDNSVDVAKLRQFNTTDTSNNNNGSPSLTVQKMQFNERN